MNQYFDEKKWDALVTSRPDWYLVIYPELIRLNELRKNVSDEESSSIRDLVYSYFQRHLEQETVVLAKNGGNEDVEREQISHIIIHHTSRESGITSSLLNAIHFTRLYVPQYASPKYVADVHMKGNPIWSGHFRDGKQHFIAYHWLVRMDGTAERFLNDNEIGWQAGNWEINKKSVAICLDNDYTYKTPENSVLQSVAGIISGHYGQIPKENILGHREVNPKTDCPGNTFLGGWKELLTAMI